MTEPVLVLAFAREQIELQGRATVGNAQTAKALDPALQRLGKGR